MAKNTFKIISLISIIASALFVILSLIITRTVICDGRPGTNPAICNFSILGLIFTLGGFVLAVILKIVSSKNTEIEGKKVITLAITLNIVLFFVWVLTYFGLFIPSH